MLWPVRTTVTLDEDVAKRLERARRERNLNFKAALNEALRAGLPALESPERPARETRGTIAVDLGRQLVDIDNIADALAVSEGDGFR